MHFYLIYFYYFLSIFLSRSLPPLSVWRLYNNFLSPYLSFLSLLFHHFHYFFFFCHSISLPLSLIHFLPFLQTFIRHETNLNQLMFKTRGHTINSFRNDSQNKNFFGSFDTNVFQIKIKFSNRILFFLSNKGEWVCLHFFVYVYHDQDFQSYSKYFILVITYKWAQ